MEEDIQSLNGMNIDSLMSDSLDPTSGDGLQNSEAEAMGSQSECQQLLIKKYLIS